MKERAATAIFNLPSELPICRTYCIIGQGRGGTTMVANLVDMLGIHLSKSSRENAEDEEFRNAIVQYHFDNDRAKIEIEIAKQIKKRNMNPVWAWKIPQSGAFLSSWYHLLRKPFWIYVVRDHLASALTEVRLDVVKDALEGLKIKCQHELYFQQFLTRMNQEQFPILMVSYERARIFKGQFLLSLITFLGANPTLLQMSKAVDYIKGVGPLQGKR